MKQLAGEETKKCLFCRLPKESGLNILDAFICSDCEKMLVNTSCADSIYDRFLQDLKKFWHGLPHKVEEKLP